MAGHKAVHQRKEGQFKLVESSFAQGTWKVDHGPTRRILEELFGGHDYVGNDNNLIAADKITEAYALLSRKQSEEQSFDQVPISDNPIADWMALHSEELMRHRGKHIAIHHKRGIVASDENFLTVYQKVKELGLEHDVVLDSIPESGYR